MSIALPTILCTKSDVGNFSNNSNCFFLSNISMSFLFSIHIFLLQNFYLLCKNISLLYITFLFLKYYHKVLYPLFCTLYMSFLLLLVQKGCIKLGLDFRPFHLN